MQSIEIKERKQRLTERGLEGIKVGGGIDGIKDILAFSPLTELAEQLAVSSQRSEVSRGDRMEAPC